MPKVAVIMGSQSDLPVLESTLKTLKKFGVETCVKVLSAHRTPVEAGDFAKNAEDNGIEVIIAAAGKAAHLPGVLAAYTPLPVIGLPVQSSFMNGLDSLLSIVQMPSGIPVATVAVNGGENAALLAIQILSIRYPDLREKFRNFKAHMASAVAENNQKVQEEMKAWEK